MKNIFICGALRACQAHHVSEDITNCALQARYSIYFVMACAAHAKVINRGGGSLDNPSSGSRDDATSNNNLTLRCRSLSWFAFPFVSHLPTPGESSQTLRKGNWALTTLLNHQKQTKPRLHWALVKENGRRYRNDSGFNPEPSHTAEEVLGDAQRTPVSYGTPQRLRKIRSFYTPFTQGFDRLVPRYLY